MLPEISDLCLLSLAEIYSFPGAAGRTAPARKLVIASGELFSCLYQLLPDAFLPN
jgi:hypothetical protein